MGYRADHHNNLLSALIYQQKEILEKLDDCYNELTDINDRDIFAYAFKLGASMILALSLNRTKRKLIFLTIDSI